MTFFDFSLLPKFCAVGLTVNGNSVNLTSGSASYAAIDTGTTLVGGPNDAIAALYAQIPGSQALSGDNAGYYTYRTSAVTHPGGFLPVSD